MSNDDRKPPCLELRCKEMFYKDISQAPTEHERAMAAAFGKWDTRTFSPDGLNFRLSGVMKEELRRDVP